MAVDLTSVGRAVGTPSYMAPEQVVGDQDADDRADLYTLGVLACEMLTGAARFAGRSPQALLAAHLVESAPPVTEARPDLPPTLATIIVSQLLAKSPGDRPWSADAVAASRRALGISTW